MQAIGLLLLTTAASTLSVIETLSLVRRQTSPVPADTPAAVDAVPAPTPIELRFTCPEGLTDFGTYCYNHRTSRFSTSCRSIDALGRIDWHQPTVRVWGQCPEKHSCKPRFPRANGPWTLHSDRPKPQVECVPLKTRKPYRARKRRRPDRDGEGDKDADRDDGDGGVSAAAGAGTSTAAQPGQAREFPRVPSMTGDDWSWVDNTEINYDLSKGDFSSAVAAVGMREAPGWRTARHPKDHTPGLAV